MSIQTLKKKSVIKYGGNSNQMWCSSSPHVSGRSPGGIWMRALPFVQKNGHSESNANYGSSGFSLNGGTRSNTYIGKSSAFSTVRTPFRGTQPIGYGGHLGQYPISVVTATPTEVASNQYKYIKPSTVSTKTMLAEKLKWIYYSQYPNVWVQPTYPTGPLDQNASMISYIEKIKSQNCTSLGMETPPRCQCDDGANNYTKQVSTAAMSYDQYFNYFDRKCLNPKGDQKPFPFNIKNNRKFSNSCCGEDSTNGYEQTRVYFESPAWYRDQNC